VAFDPRIQLVVGVRVQERDAVVVDLGLVPVLVQDVPVLDEELEHPQRVAFEELQNVLRAEFDAHGDPVFLVRLAWALARNQDHPLGRVRISEAAHGRAATALRMETWRWLARVAS
jgi:hypothetical protein